MGARSDNTMKNWPLQRQRQPQRRAAAVIALVGLLGGCSFDGLLLTEMTRSGHPQMPDPAPQTLTGAVAEGGGAALSILSGEGKPMAGASATADSAGKFGLQLDGATSLNNALLQARIGRRQWLALLPELPAQPTVLAPPRSFALAELSPGVLQMDATGTTLALLMAGKLKRLGQNLSGASSSALVETAIGAHQQLLAGEPALVAFAQIVARIHGQASAQQGAETQVPYVLSGAPSLLNLAFLQAQPVDVDGDGAADLTTAAFDAALDAATDAFAFKACYVPDKIRVVIQTRLLDNPKNGNCESFLPYQWTSKAAEKRVFITGGIHKDTLRCTAVGQTQCLTQEQVDAGNAALGNWKPNVVAMYDDGTHGDGSAGDGIWTAAVDMPYLEPNLGATPVRIAYKFTYGQPAQGWTDSEEFPGNQRILELVDVSGDHVITRFDLFGDETSNKDKKNGLFAGCDGQMKWLEQTAEGCPSDTRERKVDIDGDCVIDSWPPASSVGPLAIPCAK
jgi:hypothetical protein